MHSRGAKWTNFKIHVAVVRSIRIVVVEINSINDSRDFKKTQNMHNSAFRYKIDTNSKTENVDI